MVERGKASLATVNATVSEQLLARCDVLLSAAPVEQLGRLSASAPLDRHPHLVHTVITPYGFDGPHADRPGFDALVAARLGLMAEQEGHREGPIFLGHPAIDYCTAFLATVGTLSALHVRDRTGRGQLVDTSLLDGALAVSSMNWWWNERDLSYLARTGDEKGFGRNRIITDLFRCRDGEYLMVHTGGEGGFKRTMELLGLGDKVRAVPGLEMSTPLDDDEYHAARHLVAEAFAARDRDDWIQRFHDADLAALPVLHPEEIFADDQLRHAGVAVDLPDEELGSVRQIGPVVHYTSSPPAAPRAAPSVGGDDGELAGWLDRPLIHVDRDAGDIPAAPLAGLRVLDFSAFFATAFGARLLCDLGADVIKVEPVSGDQMRPLADLFECAQRGKRNLAVDMRTPDGAEVVRRLVAGADVVMHNMRPGKAEKLGIGAEQCRAINPDLIYCYLPGFGSSGPKSELKSFAPLVSGFTGMLYIGAGAGNPPIRRVHGNEDLYNGFLGAIAVLMAIAHRDRTGEGQYVECPHLHSSLLVRTEQGIDGNGNALPALELDADQTGWSPLYRLHRTSDGWIALACVGDGAFRRLADALGRSELAADPRFATTSAREQHAADLEDELVATFAEMTCTDAFARLDAASVPCEIPAEHPLVPEMLWDEWALETGRIFDHHHPEHGWVREVGHCVRLSATPPVYTGSERTAGPAHTSHPRRARLPTDGDRRADGRRVPRRPRHRGGIMTLERAIGACPVIDIDFRPERPAFWHFASLDAVRQQGTITWNETPGGFWMGERVRRREGGAAAP